MTARDMFEALNLEQIRNDDNYIEYVRNGLGGYISILFSLRWKSIKSTYGYQARGTNHHEIPLDELKAIIQQCKELGWLEEKDEHFEEKAETNAEYYLNDLLKIGRHFCFMHEKVKNCCDVGCAVCTFGKGDCDKERFKWLASQYKKPTYKLSQFEYDLIQTYCYVHEGYTLSKFKRLIKLKDKGYFKCADYDTKIQDILANCEVIE